MTNNLKYQKCERPKSDQMTNNLKYQKCERPKNDQMTDHQKFQKVTCVDFGWTLTRFIVNVMQARKVAAPPFGIWPLRSNKAVATKAREGFLKTASNSKIQSCTIQNQDTEWLSKYNNTLLKLASLSSNKTAEKGGITEESNSKNSELQNIKLQNTKSRIYKLLRFNTRGSKLINLASELKQRCAIKEDFWQQF